MVMINCNSWSVYEVEYSFYQQTLKLMMANMAQKVTQKHQPMASSIPYSTDGISWQNLTIPSSVEL